MSPAATERRRSMRFGLTLPVRVVRLSEQAVDLDGETCNVSSAGAYFVVEDQDLRAGSRIEFYVSFPPELAAPGSPRVKLRCRGRVVRIETLDGRARRGVAATIDRYQFIRLGAEASPAEAQRA